eukprot:TRINITY_DN15951_c0_g1_i1.p1 TRINITY_DN15951_c0_g1~~TRINITY_DN15951_c0_g1_i1.p1  ORF type:complete len:653 (-),score=119.55 TRINITY_DN15951_c0_g1_i1:1217-3175(-)
MTASFVEEDEQRDKGAKGSNDSPESNGGVILVGVKGGSKGHELLTWALVKAAQPADKVIALHILTDTKGLPSNGHDKSDEEVTSVFNSAIEVYEGFCSLKQVCLQFKIAHGCIMQKVLAEEAKQCGAVKVILGASKHKNLGTSISLAKSCAKRSPLSTSVVVVENGKVVFERHGAEHVLEKHHPPSTGFFTQMRSKFRRRLSKDFDSCAGGSPTAGDNFSLDTILSPNSSDGSPRLNDKMFDQFSSSDDSKSPRESESLSAYGSDQSVSDVSEKEAKGDNCMVNGQTDINNANPDNSTEKRLLGHGWSLLRTIISLHKFPSLSTGRRTTLIEWVLQHSKKHAQMSEESQTESHACKSCDLQQEPELSNEGLSNKVSCEKKNFSCNEHYPLNGEANTLALKLAEVCKSKSCKCFTYQELETASSGFSQENFIGQGGWSKVYRGLFPDGKSVAVKVLNPSPHVEEEILSEVGILTSLNHRTIITLLGYCIEGTNCLLVYEFICRGNLEQILQDKERPVLPWKERMKIAVGVAEALDYLHNKCSPFIIHGDVKSSNILISEDFEPQLSDFGLAKQSPTTSTYISCNDILGTFGYLAPEYFVYGKINDKTDVYAFGVVLLELMTGRKPIDTTNPKGQESLVMWAQPPNGWQHRTSC